MARQPTHTVTPAYVTMMAAYNAEMNRRLYTAAGRLPDNVRRANQGAFWASIHGTMAHLIWADRQWMSRFADWERNTLPLAQSAQDDQPFTILVAERTAFDSMIECWASTVSETWLNGDLAWFSGAAGREMRRPLGILVPHFFNHQTHHRGQVHALLTAAGEHTGDTDLMLIA